MQRRLILLLAVAAASMPAVPASAQIARPERPYRGLYGSGLGEGTHTLVAGAGLGGGFDNNVVAAVLFRDRPSDLNTAYKGGVAHGSGSLRYALNLETVSFSAAASSLLHYVPSVSNSVLRRSSANVGLGVRLTPEIAIDTSVQYAPYSLSSLFPGLTVGPPNTFVAPREDGAAWQQDAPVLDPDFVGSVDHHLSYSIGGSYERWLSRRSVLSAGYGYRWRNASAITGFNFSNHRASGGWRYMLSQDLQLRAEYGYQQSSRTSRGDTVRNHFIDGGLDYNRALSFSRRTTLTFGSGTSLVTRPDPFNDRVRLRLNGNLGLAHEIGRSWMAEVSYGRNVRFDENFGDVVASDGVSAGFGGQVTQRLSFHARAGQSLGTIGSGENRDYDGRYGNASLGMHVSRHVSLSLTYAYYRHRFDPAIELPIDYTGTYNRHSIRASLNVWAPLLPRSRRR